MRRFYNFFLKITFLSLLIGFYTNAGFAAIYYVSNTGNDSNSGLSSSLPWKSLTKVNSVTFLPGDQVLFQRGDTFYGTITVKSSGTSSAPIVYGAYGTGNNPVITGFTAVSGWTSLGGNIWESSNTVSTLSTCNLVTIKGVNTPMGRTPNLGSYYTLQSHNANSSITSSNLSGIPNWSGAEVVIRKERWIWQKGKITSQSGGTISYTDEGQFTPRDNWGFFIQNDARTLDSQNEWYYNPTTKKVRVYSTTQPTNVRVASLEYVINSASKNYITITNLTVTGANTTGINISAGANVIVQNCVINNCGLDGVRAQSASNYYTFNNNLVKNCNYSGIHTYSNTNHHETITNNTLDSCAMVIGIGRLYAPAAIFSAAENTLIQYNKVDHSGYDGMMVTSDRGQVKNNFVNNSLLNRSDGGGIYTAGANVDLIIDGNIVLNTFGYTGATNNGTSMGVGIYLDLNTSYTTVSNNTITGCVEDGIYFNHHTNHNKVMNNTVFNNNVAQLAMHDYTSTGGLNNNTVTGNIFIAKSSTQLATCYRSSLNDIPSFMIVSDNNLLARPISNDNYIRAGQPNQFTGSNDYKNLAEWQSFSGKDANSKTLTKTITSESDIQIEYNATKTAKTVSLSGPMIDVKGVKYSGSVTLQPYTSVILMKDGTATTVVAPGAPTSVVATAGDARATVTFAAPTNNGGSAITGYTVTSIPAGGIDSNAGTTSLTHTITGLTNGTSYTFSVKATNAVGTSVASAPSNAVTPKSNTTPSTPVATSYTFTGPTSGNVNSASANFTVTPNGNYTGTITITPSGTGSTGLTAKVLTFSNSAVSQSFTIVPTVAGSITLTATNKGGLTNPARLTYTVISKATVPDAPTSVVATAGNGSALVTFKAPVNNGGSAITGYTVTSNPAGGVDIHAGTTSLTHTITNLKNGVFYTFTVKATNAVGTSVASAPSNSIFPRLANVTYKSAQITTGNESDIQDQDLKIIIFPNPVTDKVTVQYSIQPEDGSKIEILDMAGRRVMTRDITGMSEEFNLEQLNPGIYFVKSTIGSKEMIEKIIVRK
jgi:hypothetical protein